ncbi:hypothetical protein M422DRAFT_267011 [Sphaerobolus stellatus SS14]|uniref:Uncharacterized protein n=1 Tax=Sphaerobolus stellatus (strain SS14) TaxID=990650 RepID=A0A0C9TMY2_SPHS4|nr:hypothetical protein M422DRAFT_267011 [Sphaerobolus stellatus SS14]
MSVPNAIRDDQDGYFLKEDVDVVAWLNKISANLPHQPFMNHMKAVVGSHINFETTFSGFDSNLFHPAFQQGAGSQIHLHLLESSPKLPRDLRTNHRLLKQIYTKIIPYMVRDEEKRPLSSAAMERAAYMALHQHAPAPNKGKKSLTGHSQSKPSVHTLQPAKIRQSSQQQLDANLEAYNQHHEPVLPYSDAPPSGEPETESNAPKSVGASGTLPDESTMDIDPELDDLYS